MVESIRLGVVRAGQRWRLVLPLASVLLLFGLLQAWPALLLPGQLASSPLLERLARNDEGAVGMLLSSPGLLSAAPLVGIWVMIAVLLLLLGALAYNLLSGGMLAGLAGEPFWQACQRYFLSFCALGIVLLLLLGLLTGLLALLAWLSRGVFSGDMVAAAVLGLAQLLNLWGELARAVGVATRRRNPFALLGRAAALGLRQAPVALTLSVLGLALHLGVGVLYSWLAEPLIGSALASIALQQLAVLGWQWVKLLRLSWALAFVQAALKR